MKQTFQGGQGIVVTVDLIDIQNEAGENVEPAIDIHVESGDGTTIGIWLNDERIGQHTPEAVIDTAGA